MFWEFILVFTISPKYIKSCSVRTIFKLNNYYFKVYFLIVPSNFPALAEGEATLKIRSIGMFLEAGKGHPISLELG